MNIAKAVEAFEGYYRMRPETALSGDDRERIVAVVSSGQRHPCIWYPSTTCGQLIGFVDGYRTRGLRDVVLIPLRRAVWQEPIRYFRSFLHGRESRLAGAKDSAAPEAD